MRNTRLTEEEALFAQQLPKPPAIGAIRVSNVWIIEWLQESERKTGQLLHEWMEQRRPGWPAYRRCRTKDDVLKEIYCAVRFAKASGSVPILHLEAHGCRDGLHDGSQNQSLLRWSELAGPLQYLNVATRCNLIVFVAACIGFAGIQALTQGPIAPAIALVGPTHDLGSSELLLGAKEFYRRIQDPDAHFQRAVASSSQEMGSAEFEQESFIDLVYNATVEQLIISFRKDEVAQRYNRYRKRMLAGGKFSVEEVEARLKSLPAHSPKIAQHMWNTMFMIDRYPENEKRFGLDMMALVKRSRSLRQNADTSL